MCQLESEARVGRTCHFIDVGHTYVQNLPADAHQTGTQPIARDPYKHWPWGGRHLHDLHQQAVIGYKT